MSNFISVKAVFSLCVVGSLAFIGVANAGDSGIKTGTGQGGGANCSFLIKCATGYIEDYNSCQCVVNTKVDGSGGPKNDADGSGTGGVKPVRTNPPHPKTGVKPNSGSGSSTDSTGTGGVKPVRTSPPIGTGQSTDSNGGTGGVKPIRTSPPIGTGQSTDSTDTGKK